MSEPIIAKDKPSVTADAPVDYDFSNEPMVIHVDAPQPGTSDEFQTATEPELSQVIQQEPRQPLRFGGSGLFVSPPTSQLPGTAGALEVNEDNRSGESETGRNLIVVGPYGETAVGPERYSTERSESYPERIRLTNGDVIFTDRATATDLRGIMGLTN